MPTAKSTQHTQPTIELKMLEGLVALTGLRDRDALDLALVRLLSPFVVGARRCMGLVQILSVGQEQRCCVRARLDASQAEPYREGMWAQWGLMPELAPSGPRHAAVKQARSVVVQDAEAGTHTAFFPVLGARGVWAVVELESEQAFSTQSLSVISAAVTIYQNLMGLLDYGEKDALTELLNRKTFDGAFLKATAAQSAHETRHTPERRAGQVQGSYWLAMLDIDHFKHVNDNFGHLMGDEVLLLIARLMRANFRMHDQLYRFGGEEFVVLMHCEDADKAYIALERLRAAIQAYVFPQVGAITVRIGFSALRDKDTPAGAFGRADKAVYYAKEHGRNQVCSYQQLVLQGEIVEAAAAEMDVDLF